MTQMPLPNDVTVTLTLEQIGTLRDAARLAQFVSDNDWDAVVAWQGACGGSHGKAIMDETFDVVEAAVRPERLRMGRAIRDWVAGARARMDQDLEDMGDGT